MLENKLQNFWNVLKMLGIFWILWQNFLKVHILTLFLEVFFPEITLKQLGLKNYSSYNLLLFKMRRKLFVLFFKNFKQSIETSGYIPELLKTTLIAFEETLIKTLMEVWSSGICTRRDQYGKGFNKFVQDFNEFGEL